MIVYNKLVRDKIPEIINAQGKSCEVRTLDNGEYLNELNKKLKEELNEYYGSGDLEELADITEIIYAISQHKGVSIKEFEKLRQDKRDKRGGFEKKLFLLNVSKMVPSNFEDVWKDIIESIKKDNVVVTLTSGNEDIVEEILPDGLMVRTTHGEAQLVKKEWIENAWNVLYPNETIKPDDIPGTGKFRSSFIMALFARFDYVRYDTNPIRLHLKYNK